MQNDFQVVDHQIEHGPDIGAAIWVGREAMGFDESRMSKARFERNQDRIESLGVANLQDHFVLGRKFRKFSCLLWIFRNWLFDKQMLSAPQKLARDLEMRLSGSGDRRRVHRMGEFMKRSLGRSAIFLGNRVRARMIDIEDGSEVHGRNFGVNPRVIAPDMADTDYSNAKFFHLATFLRNQS